MELRALTTQLQGLQLTDDPQSPHPPSIQRVIDEYMDVFAETTALPPRRELDHQIVLREGQSSINVRPYRYLFAQKKEIERIMDEILTAGVIRPSNSPYSSHVLLVKKKDESWHFCVDYRVLNNATVPDKFSVPVIEELLNELHESYYFSKLDLKSGYHQIRMKPEDVAKMNFERTRVTTNSWSCHLA